MDATTEVRFIAGGEFLHIWFRDDDESPSPHAECGRVMDDLDDLFTEGQAQAMYLCPVCFCQAGHTVENLWRAMERRALAGEVG